MSPAPGAPARIVLASANPGKLREIRALLPDWEVVAQSELGIAPAAETGLTFVENALIKARHAARHTRLPALADDSGLEVDALGGQPGVHSARFAGPGASDAANLARLIERVRDVPEPERGARYRCVVVYLAHAADPMPIVAEGTWEGRLASVPRGGNGFGYDPVFVVPDQGGRTAAELPAALKNRLSHRGQALCALRDRLAASRHARAASS